jgi:hypothetical protein
MDSEERPYSTHDTEDRECEYCGDVFPAHHGLQKYCPEKFGKKNYCLNKQKAMVNQTKLASLVNTISNSSLISTTSETDIEANRRIISEIMGTAIEKEVSSDLLDHKGFDPRIYDSRYMNSSSDSYTVCIGDYSIEWIDEIGGLLMFKIVKR